MAARRKENKLIADTGTTTTTYEPARRALGEFLRVMRGRLKPPTAGRVSRRRVRGLRREEVATAAGISPTWYTWLEQGRPVRVSSGTIQGISRALKLAKAERAHLVRLARAASGAASRTAFTQEVSDGLRALVTNLAPHPAYVVNALWDVLYRNRSADAVFGDFEREPGCTDNVLRRLLLDPEWRDRFEDWEAVACSAIAQFRAATGQLVGTSEWRQFIANLRAESSWFAERWDAHTIAPAATYTKVVRHPTAGRLIMLYASLAAAGEVSGVSVIVYTPADAETAARIRELSGVTY